MRFSVVIPVHNEAVLPERWSPGIRATYAVVAIGLTISRLSGGLFWCRRSDFEAVHGDRYFFDFNP